MKYKLIGTDFDGTLLNDERILPEENFKSLNKARKKEIKTVGVTGITLKGTTSELDVSCFDYLILNNGSYIYDNNNKKVLEEITIPKKIAEEITKDVINKSIKIDYCTLNDYNILKEKVKSEKDFIKEIKNLEEVQEKIAKINITVNDNDIDDIFELLKNKYSDYNVFIMQDSNSIKKWIVVNPMNVNKHKSLEKLGKILNISLEEMIFFGDGANDIEAIKEVGLGIAMDNSLPIVKDNAKEITKSNNECGVSLYIEKILEES